MSDFSGKATNILTNMIAPYAGSDRIVGTTFNVAAEVIVESAVRMMIGQKKLNWFDMVAYHAISQPFMMAFLASGDLTDVGKGDYWDQVVDGFRGVPAVLLAKYILFTYYRGFFVPGFDWKELLMTAGTKTITRPIVHTVQKWLPKTLQDQLAVVDAIYKSQMANSNLKMKN
jgi:hypothetical protein